MGIRDNDIERARQRMYIPVWQFQGYEETTDLLHSAGTGNPVPLELTTSGIVGLQIGAAGDLIIHSMGFPSYWDITEDIGVRVWWLGLGHNATTDSVTWLFEYSITASGGQVAVPATALNTAIANQAIGTTTTRTIIRGTRGVINRNTFTEANVDGLFVFEVEADSIGTFSANEVYLMGVAFDYMPVRCVGGQNALPTSRN